MSDLCRRGAPHRALGQDLRQLPPVRRGRLPVGQRLDRLGRRFGCLRDGIFAQPVLLEDSLGRA